MLPIILGQGERITYAATITRFMLEEKEASWLTFRVLTNTETSIRMHLGSVSSFWGLTLAMMRNVVTFTLVKMVELMNALRNKPIKDQSYCSGLCIYIFENCLVDYIVQNKNYKIFVQFLLSYIILTISTILFFSSTL